MIGCASLRIQIAQRLLQLVGDLPCLPGALDRVTRLHSVGTHITKVALGELVIWDTPTGFAVKSLRIPDMLLHHVLFAGVAYLSYASGVFSVWAVLFFGAIEVSSVPLTQYRQMQTRAAAAAREGRVAESNSAPKNAATSATKSAAVHASPRVC